ncbi:hypothetical protein [Streptomyces sannanensis]
MAAVCVLQFLLNLSDRQVAAEPCAAASTSSTPWP